MTAKLKFAKTKKTFHGAIIWEVLRGGVSLGHVHRTGMGDRYWCNDNECRVYYLGRSRAATGLVKSLRYSAREKCPYCHRPIGARRNR